MTERPCWVVSDGTTHVVALDSSRSLVTHCRQRLPADSRRHDQLPGLRLCPECVAAYLLPVPCSRATLRLANGSMASRHLWLPAASRSQTLSPILIP